MSRRYTEEEKARVVAEVLGGAATREVAGRMGIHKSLIYRWVQDSAEQSAPKFARVVRAQEVIRSTLAVQVAGAVVQVQTGFDAGLLRAVVLALSSGEAK